MKNLAYGATALLIMSLFLPGCPQGVQNVENTVQSASEFIVRQQYVIKKNDAIESGEVWRVASGGTLQIEDGVTFTVKSGGTLVAEEEDGIMVSSSGTLVVDDGGQVILGTVTKHPGVYGEGLGSEKASGLIDDLGGMEYATRDGEITQVTLKKDVALKKDTILPFGMTLIVPVGKTLSVIAGKLDVAGTLDVAGMLQCNRGAITTGTTGEGSRINSKIVVQNENNLKAVLGAATKDMPVAIELKNNVILSGPSTVPVGATLTVPAQTMLYVAGTLTVAGTLEMAGKLTRESGATIITQEKGKLVAHDADNLMAALDGATKDKPVAVEVKNDIELSDTTVVFEGATLTIPDDITLTIPAQKTLRVAGTIALDGKSTLRVSGILDVAGKISIAKNGVMNVQDGGEYILEGTADGGIRLDAGTNKGTVYIRSGGVTHGKGGAVDGVGLNVVEAGGMALYTQGSPTQRMIDGTNSTAKAVFKFTSGTLSFNNWEYILDGTGTLASNFQLLSSRHQILTVNSSSTLTIASGVTLSGEADTTNPANTTQIVNKGTIVVQGTSNFYPGSGTTALPSPIGSGTYTWSETAGGPGTPGWKKQ
jgi:hypothetical protein